MSNDTVSKGSMRRYARHSLSIRYFFYVLIATLLRSISRPAMFLGIYYFNRHKVPGVTMRSIRIPSRDKGRTILAHVYEKNAGRMPTNRKPVLISWHGSGFVIDALGADDHFCARMAGNLDCVVLDMDYRKAPENPFPLSHEDAEDATRWVFSQRDKFDTTRVGLHGFSAGGSLALATSHTLGPKSVTAVTAFYPGVYYTIMPDQKVAPGTGPGPWMMRLFNFFHNCLIPTPKAIEDTRLSLCEAPTDQYPPVVFLAVGQDDILHDDSVKLATKLEEEDHPNVTFKSVPGGPHAFDKEDMARHGDKYWAKVQAVHQLAWKQPQSPVLS